MLAVEDPMRFSAKMLFKSQSNGLNTKDGPLEALIGLRIGFVISKKVELQ